MRIIFIFLALIFTSNINSQTEYYTTDGKNRISKFELEKMSSDLKERYSKVSNNEMFVTIRIDETIKVGDSIIHQAKFDIRDKKSFENFINNPFEKLKNKEFPDFELMTINGENFSSKVLNGKPTLINFWFTNCAPCIAEMPALNKIYEQYRNEINFIAITFETKEKVDKFLKKHSFDFKHLVNAKEFTDELRILTYPMNIFLDDKGLLKYVKGGIPFETNENGEVKIGEGNEIIQILEKLK